MSDQPHAYFRIQLGRYPDERHDFSFVVPISEIAVHDWLRPIDEPDEAVAKGETIADRIFMAMICTPQHVIAEVKRGRERIGKEIASEFMNAIAKLDKTMGYARENKP